MAIEVVHFWEEVPLSELPKMIIVIFETLSIGIFVAVIIISFFVLIYGVGRLCIHIYNASLRAVLSMECSMFALSPLGNFKRALSLAAIRRFPKPFDLRVALASAKGLTASGDTALDRMFNIAEVAELILCEVTVSQLLELQTVNKLFLRYIRESPKVRKQFFWALIEPASKVASSPHPNADFRLKPFIDWFATTAFGEPCQLRGNIGREDADRLVCYFLPHALRAVNDNTSGVHQVMLTDPPTTTVFLAAPEKRKNSRSALDLSEHRGAADRGEGMNDVQIYRQSGVTLGDVLFSWKMSNVIKKKAYSVGIWFPGLDFKSRLRNRARCHALLAKQHYRDVSNALRHGGANGWEGAAAKLIINDGKKWMAMAKREQDKKLLEIFRLRIVDEKVKAKGGQSLDAVEWQILAGELSDLHVVCYGTICASENNWIDYAHGLDLGKLGGLATVTEDFVFGKQGNMSTGKDD